MTTYSYTGAVQNYVVPANVTKVLVKAWGAQGGNYIGIAGGLGGYAEGILTVTPGETLNVYVGGQATGWNGGGGSQFNTASGGGASDVRRGGTALANRVIVGGGGGGASSTSGRPGAVGGGLVGGSAVGGSSGGGGGTQSAGGSGSDPGELGVGGSYSSMSGHGGGGGGGYYGGGAGYYDYGGGGGSSYIGGLTDAVTTSGQRTGNGQVIIEPANDAPNAPTLTTLIDGEVIDRAAVNRAAHVFSDPNAGDSQSAFDHRYRLIGAASWTTAYVVTPNQYVDYPAGTFAAGDYERQVRTYDAQGVAGPWSGSGFFTAADAPPTPTITSPANGATVGSSAPVTWSTPNQAAYQVQVLDGGVVEHDTGEVVSASDRTAVVPFPDNNTTRTVRVRIKLNGLWSSWYAITVTVSYTPPATPTVALAAAGTAITVTVTNPAPATGEPAVTHNRVYVDDADGRGETLRVGVLPANGIWTYHTPRAGIDYGPLVRVVAVGNNGTEASSA